MELRSIRTMLSPVDAHRERSAQQRRGIPALIPRPNRRAQGNPRSTERSAVDLSKDQPADSVRYTHRASRYRCCRE
jgi:hypothetical protein